MLRRVFAVDFLPDAEFKMTYRLTKCTFKKLLEIVSPHLTTSRWNNRLFPETKLLIALRFFASGSYQLCIGKNRETSSAQSTVSKVLTEVINVFEHVVCPQFITFPTLQEREEIKEWFVTKHKIPNVIGCIDGTQIGIYPPSENENVYMNRKGFHSINVQIICDHTYRIRNVVAKYPGSAHDSYVYKYSTIRDQLQDEFLHGNDSQWLLADSGYPLEPWMLTPFAANSEDPHEILYNRHFCGACCLVERVIGLLKGRWRCLFPMRSICLFIFIEKTCLTIESLGTCTEKEINNIKNGNIGDRDFQTYNKSNIERPLHGC
ncbi:putative nuclease HARBI1 [Planococcus citri]|uniref:putative nuclease HARBI1 n=1 Tax=Planococcus citri TaxID=170843 RepID=UPI0031F9C005